MLTMLRNKMYFSIKKESALSFTNLNTGQTPVQEDGFLHNGRCKQESRFANLLTQTVTLYPLDGFPWPN